MKRTRGKKGHFGGPENSSENKGSSLKNKQDLNPLPEVKKIRLKNVNKAIIGQTNIKSKFEQLKELVLKKLRNYNRNIFLCPPQK